MERKLASLQIIDSLSPIDNADRIELAKVLGWQVVVKKDEFKVRDLIIYCEIDSLLPEKPEFEFLRPRKFRIKSMKLKGVLSQGIIFSIDFLPEDVKGSVLAQCLVGNKELIGTDVTEKMGITKYEPPISPQMMGKILGDFPTHIIPKTDEIRLQSIPDILSEFVNREIYISTKMDGTSFTCYHLLQTNTEEPHKFGVCSRNLELKEDETVYWDIAHKLNLKQRLTDYFVSYNKNIAIQGEICGPGINKNHAGLKKLSLFIFNIYDIDQQKCFNFDDLNRTAAELQLETVPIDWIGKFDIKEFTVEKLIEMARGKYSGTNNNREGIVIRPVCGTSSEVVSSYGGDPRRGLSTKVINNDYLLKAE
jgi:RNA ligase (TIGR02306 family)